MHYSFIDEDPLKVLRDIRLKKFPYVIVFEIIKNDVLVYAMHHLHKHTGINYGTIDNSAFTTATTANDIIQLN